MYIAEGNKSEDSFYNPEEDWDSNDEENPQNDYPDEPDYNSSDVDKSSDGMSNSDSEDDDYESYQKRN